MGHDNYLTGAIRTNLNVLNDATPSFPVFARHQSLYGFFKFFPVNGDTMNIIIEMYKNGIGIGRGGFSAVDSVTQFQQFNVVINYDQDSTQTMLTPDSATIEIKCADEIAHGPSRVIVDKLSFDGLYTSTISLAFAQHDELAWQIYPNPAQNALFVEFKGIKSETHKLTIFDLNGKEVYQTEITSDKGSRTSSVIPLDGIGNGFYVVTLSYRGGVQFKKLIISE